MMGERWQGVHSLKVVRQASVNRKITSCDAVDAKNKFLSYGQHF